MPEFATKQTAKTSPFLGLAETSGFSVRQCEVAAATGRLPDVIRIAERRSAGRRAVPTSGHLSGALALAMVRARTHPPSGPV
jgi:hypothetical protein